MDLTMKIVLAIFASTGFWNFLTTWLTTKKKRKTPVENMILALGRDKLLFLNKKYRKMGFIPEDDFETYNDLGDAYIGMGGNNLVKKGFEENRKLPIREEEE